MNMSSSPSHLVSTWKTLFNFVMAVIGMGILTLSTSMAEAGWGFSIFLFVGTFALCHTGVVLLYKCVEATKSVDLPSVGLAAFGGLWGYWLVGFVNSMYVITVCAAMIELLGSIIHQFELVSYKIQGVWISTLFMIFPCMLANFNEMSFISIFGVIAVFVALFSVILFCYLSLANESREEVVYTPFTSSVLSLGKSFANYINSYTATPALPNMIAEMRKPRDIVKVSVYGFSIVTLVFVVIGYSGYYTFGQSLLTSSQLAERIHKDHRFPYINYIVQGSLIVTAVSQFIMLFYPVAETVTNHVKVSKEGFGKYAVRVALVVLCGGLASTPLNFQEVATLLGATFGNTVQVVFPVLFYHLLFNRNSRIKLIMTSLVICFSVGIAVCGIMGVVTNL
jgi:solute carrier family 36 (proton-coupled amino acid transporter)